VSDAARALEASPTPFGLALWDELRERELDAHVRGSRVHRRRSPSARRCARATRSRPRRGSPIGGTRRGRGTDRSRSPRSRGRRAGLSIPLFGRPAEPEALVPLVSAPAVVGEVPRPLEAGLGAGRSYLRLPTLIEPCWGTDPRPRRLHRCQRIPPVPPVYRRATCEGEQIRTVPRWSRNGPPGGGETGPAEKFEALLSASGERTGNSLGPGTSGRLPVQVGM